MSGVSAAKSNMSRWLFGPAPDLLIGCGVLYGLLFAAFAFGGSALREAQPGFIGPMLIVLVSMPHYGATLLRVYDQSADRRRYAIFSVHITIAMVALFIAGLYVPWIASALFTVYVTWSPWHYTGQNYGIAVMFLRRGGVDPTPLEKRLLYASFILCFALVFLALHAEGAPVTEGAKSGSGIYFVSIGLPTVVENTLFPVLVVAYVGALAGAMALLGRRGGIATLGPPSAIALTQALWFAVPFAARFFDVVQGVDPLRMQFRGFYFTWIALGHAAQYLWITAYYARNSNGGQRVGPFLVKTLLAGNAIWTLPVLLFGSGVMGGLGFSSGLMLLVASVVNLHHFILDGAIWKLRSPRIAKALLRPVEASVGSDPIVAQGIPRRLAWLAMCALMGVAGTRYWHEHFVYPRASRARDFDAMRESLDTLAALGVDRTPARHRVLRTSAIRDHLLQSREADLASAPSAMGYLQLGDKYREAGDIEGAVRCYESGLEIQPNLAGLRHRAGAVWLELGDARRSLVHLERALAAEPWNETSRRIAQEARVMLENDVPARILGY